MNKQIGSIRARALSVYKMARSKENQLYDLQALPPWVIDVRMYLVDSLLPVITTFVTIAVRIGASGQTWLIVSSVISITTSYYIDFCMIICASVRLIGVVITLGLRSLAKIKLILFWGIPVVKSNNLTRRKDGVVERRGRIFIYLETLNYKAACIRVKSLPKGLNNIK